MGMALADRNRTTEVLEPAEFAERVRQVAVDTHRVLRSPVATCRELRELANRIEALYRQSRGIPERQVDRWLQNAARRIRELRPDPCSEQSGS
jgi:hypothetical protein